MCLCVCVVCTGAPVPPDDGKVDFLGMSVSGKDAVAGQWVLLVLGLVFLLTTFIAIYYYRKAKNKSEKSLSTMELKQKD